MLHYCGLQKNLTITGFQHCEHLLTTTTVIISLSPDDKPHNKRQKETPCEHIETFEGHRFIER